jgi:hypothetical protein
MKAPGREIRGTWEPDCRSPGLKARLSQSGFFREFSGSVRQEITLPREGRAAFKERLCHDLRKRITLSPGGSRGTSGEGEHVTARKFDV